MKTIVISIAFMFLAGNAYAVNLLETKSQSRQRHSAQNYQYYQQHGTPLGGYPETLGDPAPYGTERPGYVDRY